MLTYIKSLFRKQPVISPERAHKRAYLEKHGHDLRCHHCDRWQSSALTLDQAIECEAVPNQHMFFVLVCAACHERTTFFDTGFMGACVSVEHEAALRGDVIQLARKTESPCLSTSASPQ